MSEQVTHALGPWSLRMRPAVPEMHQREYPEQVIDANGKPIVLCCVVITSSREGEPLANTRLIAAAPKMLAALKAQHKAIDILFAMLIDLDHKFIPTKSQVWPMLLGGLAAIDEAEGRAP